MDTKLILNLRVVTRSSAPGFCLLAALAAACLSANGHAAEVESPDPLAVGLRWEASFEMTAPDGSVHRGKAHREIVGTEIIRGTNYFVSVTRFTGLPGLGGYTTFRRKAEDGIHAISATDSERAEYLETALPLEVGKRWTTRTLGGQTAFRVTGRESVKIGQHQYDDCFRIEYESTGAMPSGRFFLAPGVGNVSETFAVGGTKVQVTLDSFEKRKPGPSLVEKQ